MAKTLELVSSIKHLLKVNKVVAKDQRAVVEATLGEYFAYHVPLPGGPVADVPAFFRAHCKVQCLQELALINEHIVFDLDAACDMVFKLWQVRYRLVFRPDLPSIGRLSMMCVNKNIIDEKHASAIATYPNALLPRGELVPTGQAEV